MAQPRMNVYGFAHKGLRHGFSQLSFYAGNTNCSDPEALTRLRELTNEIFTLLDQHAQVEESFILPALESKVPGSTEHNVIEHELLDAEFSALQSLFNTMAVESAPAVLAHFYAAFSVFQAKYLAHMEMEESKMNPLFWDNFSDEELLGVQGQVMAWLTPDQKMMWFKYMIPAMNPVERVVLLSGVKANAPQPFLDAVLSQASQRLTKNEHQALVSALK